MFGASRLVLSFVFALAVGAGAGVAFGGEQNVSSSNRGALASEYLEASREHPPLYQGAPVTHLVPSFNTITYALALEHRDITVEPESLNPSNRGDVLKLGGYGVSPYLALSLKHVGLGFSVDAGRKTAEYTRPSASAGGGETQESTLDYRAVGIYLYLIPVPSKMVTTTIIVGGKSYTAKHRASATAQGRALSYGDFDTHNYSVPSYEVGLNVGVKLLKSFSVIPWVDYVHNDSRAAIEAAKKKPFTSEQNVRDDVELFWHDKARVQYGLDFAVNLGPFEVRLGGLLGAVASVGAERENVQDDSLELAVSLEQKGN